MGLLGKKSNEVIDYTMLQKLGLLKKEEIKQDVIDFTSNSSGNIANQNSVSAPAGSGDPFSFMDNLAAVGTSNSVNNPLNNANNSDFSGDINSIKIKIDDLDYKLNIFNEQLERVESKLLDFERKIGYNPR